MVNLALQLGWSGQSPFNVGLMIWKSVKGLKSLGRTIPQERPWSCKCSTLPDGSQEGMASSMSSMHVVEQSTHLRSRQDCYFDVEVVDKFGNRFENVSLDFHQSLVNGHLQVTVKNFDEFFKIEANVVIGEVQQCSSPSCT